MYNINNITREELNCIQLQLDFKTFKIQARNTEQEKEKSENNDGKGKTTVRQCHDQKT